MKPVAVTGAGGFVGRRVMTALRHLDVPTVTIPTERLLLALSSKEARHSRELLSSLLKGCSAVIHAAGLAHQPHLPADAFDVANHQTAKLIGDLAAQAGVARLVHVSSIAVHGRRHDGPAGPSTPCKPDSHYGLSKARAEDALCQIADTTDLQVMCLRPPLVSGAGAPGNLALLRRAILLGLPLPAPSWNRRDIVGVRNLADMIVQACRVPLKKTFDALPVCDGQSVSTLEIVSAIAEGAGCSARPIQLSRSAAQWLSSAPFVGARLVQLCGDLEVDGREAQLSLQMSLQHRTFADLAATGRGSD